MLLSKAEIVNALGAFDTKTFLDFPNEKQNEVYSRLIKRIAIIVESIHGSGKGELVFQVIDEASSREELELQVESLLLFGKTFQELSEEEKEIARRLEAVDEQHHFSRIMDIDEMLPKKIVGEADAGNPLMARMTLNVVTKIEAIKGKDIFYPLPSREIAFVEDKKYFNGAFRITRKNYPYIYALIQGSSKVVDYFRKLIVQYPLEITVGFIEEWAMRVKQKFKIVAVQVLPTRDEYKAKIFCVGGGVIGVFTRKKPMIFKFPEEEEKVGKKDCQPTYHRTEISVKPGDEFFLAFDKSAFDKIVEKDFTKAEAHFASAKKPFVRVRIKKLKPFREFQWSESYVRQKLRKLVQEIIKRNPEEVNVQAGHIHADRDPAQDQFIGVALIAKVFIKMLVEAGFKGKIVFVTMIDNYHVTDRLDYVKYIKQIEQWLAEVLPVIKKVEVMFEDSLLSRALGEELVKDLPLMRVGDNLYYQPHEYMLIEIVANAFPNDPRDIVLGCVPFEVGWELGERLMREQCEQRFREWVLERDPESLLARWYRKHPGKCYAEIVFEELYKKTNDPEEREKIKKELERVLGVDWSQRTKREIFKEIIEEFKKKPPNKELVHVLEGFYDAQDRKFRALWEACNLPKVPIHRISFTRKTGEMKILSF